jgi:hypothetical protein
LPSPCASVPHAGHSSQSSVLGRWSVVVSDASPSSVPAVLSAPCHVDGLFRFSACYCAFSAQTHARAGRHPCPPVRVRSPQPTSSSSQSQRTVTVTVTAMVCFRGLPPDRAGTRSCRSSIVKVRTSCLRRDAS